MICCTSGLHAETLDVPVNIFTFDQSIGGRSKVKESDRIITKQSTAISTLSFIHRRPLHDGPFYWSAGVRADNYFFDNQRSFPIDRFQSYAGRFALEYYLGSIQIAHLALRPGFYFENRMTKSSFDVPVEAFSGFPITSSLSGALGLATGRFFHHPVPIFGVNWIMNEKVTLRILYPEPALIVKVRKDLEAGLAGQLLGDGFRADRNSELERVNYFVYRAGATLRYTGYPRFNLAGGAGVEMKRQFDAFRDQRRLQGSSAPYIQLSLEFKP